MNTKSILICEYWRKSQGGCIECLVLVEKGDIDVNTSSISKHIKSLELDCCKEFAENKKITQYKYAWLMSIYLYLSWWYTKNIRLFKIHKTTDEHFHFHVINLWRTTQISCEIVLTTQNKIMFLMLEITSNLSIHIILYILNILIWKLKSCYLTWKLSLFSVQ